jgi:hypothetical protein
VSLPQSPLNDNGSPHRRPGSASRPWVDVAAIALLCALSVILYRQIALTNLILPGADAITYFYPYRAYAAESIRSGRIPLWNPYLFLGVPFLANPQAGVFYPPNLLPTWLLPAPPFGASIAPRLVAWSLVLHAALAACGAYLYARRVVRLSPLPALLGASAFAYGGFLSGQAEHVNQLNVSAWFPWLLLLWETRQKARWPALLGLGGVIGLGLLAGHTQSSYITLAGLGLYASLPTILLRRTADGPRHGGHGEEKRFGESSAQRGFAIPERGSETSLEQHTKKGKTLRALRVCSENAPVPVPGALALSSLVVDSVHRNSVVKLFNSLWQLGFALLVGLALAAVQLLPTLELSRLSIRSGGLSYHEAVAFSLRPLPRLLRYTFLPAWGRSLNAVFGGDFYTEYVAYIGLLPLLLAGLACFSWAQRVSKDRFISLHETRGRAALQMIVLSGTGVLLALGLYNPLYWVLFKVLPGFGLFRVPARWLLLYAFGAAMLAGIGLQEASRCLQMRRIAFKAPGAIGADLRSAGQRSPDRRSASWLWHIFPVVLTIVGVGELLLGAQALPLAHPTAPEAFSSLRTAPAHILAAQRQEVAPGRFLSLSHTLFDPGDLNEIEQIYQNQLPPEAIYALVVNVKRQEILAPNLPLAWRIYAVDGYDGGVLPLASYIRLQRLLLAEEDILSDGRLREGLERIPPSRLFSILGAQYAITDKVHDVWIDDVFYDLSFDTPLSVAAIPSVQSKDLPDYAATGLGIVTYLEGAQDVADGTPVAEVRLATAEGETLTYLLHAGLETAEGLYGERVRHRQARVGHLWQRQEGGTAVEGSDYVARLNWKAPRTVTQIEIEALPFGSSTTGRLHVKGVSLIDERDGSNVPTILSTEGRFRQVHSGDVKVYKALDVLPRAYAVHHTRLIAGDQAAIAAMRDPAFDPARTAILASGQEIDAPPTWGDAPSVTVLSYEPEEVLLRASLSAPGYVVLSDSYYPGWRATVDGEPSVIERANLAFRAVHVPAGTHTVRWVYRPTSYRAGLGISAAALLALATAFSIVAIRRAVKPAPTEWKRETLDA